MALKPIRGRRRFRDFLVYDLEWVPGTLDVRMVGVFDGERYRYYSSVAAFLDHEIVRENRNRWFYAHAGGLADIQFLLPHFYDNENYQIDGCFSGSSAIIVRVQKGKHSWTFCDSYWLLKDSLANIGKSVGMEKTGPNALDLQSTEEIKQWYASIDFKTLVEYNEIDLRILYSAIERFQEELYSLGGELQKTVASSAMNLFRRSYLKRPIYTNDAVNLEARESYFASRVEVFNSECHDGYYYDINSSFPFSMTFPVPGTYLGRVPRISESWLDDDSKPFFAHVDFTVPDCDLPPTPTRIAGRVFFPVGRWQAFLSSIDIRLLFECGAIIHRVNKVRTFEPRSDLKEYVEDIYSRRKATDDPFRRLVYKYLLNSLYGKFAERSEKETLLIHPETTPSREYMLTPGVFVVPKVANVPHECVWISSYITARSRYNLYHLMRQSKRYYYCDTDGFASDTPDMTTSAELGGLKLEKVIHHGKFIAPKVYRLDGMVDGEEKTIVKAKGFSLGKGKEAIERFETLIGGHDIEVDRMARIRENLRKGKVHPVETIVTKRLQNMMPKRHTYSDGSTRPYTIDELREVLS